MPRPKTKSELLEAGTNTFIQLNALIDSIPRSKQSLEFPFQHRDRRIRDVLAHLHEWQVMMLNWYRTGMSGHVPEMPTKGYSWRMTPELNDSIWKKYQKVSLKKIRNQLLQSNDELVEIIRGHSNKELFTKQYYDWTGSTSLGSYLTSALSSHYDWAIKLVRRFEKTLE